MRFEAEETGPRRISARAEEPQWNQAAHKRQSAHLRASGGTLDRCLSDWQIGGASPRERRNPRLHPCRNVLDGRISARAEEPTP